MRAFSFSPSPLSSGGFRKDSAVHRLTPGVKLAGAFILAAAVLLSPLFPQLPLLFLLLAAAGGAAGLNPAAFWRTIRPILPFLLLIGLVQIFLIPRESGAPPLFAWGVLRVFREDLLASALLFGRFFSLVLLFSLFSATTPAGEIGAGAEALLRKICPPSLAQDAALVATITFRFIPILMEEAEHIAKAQASRGGEFGTWKMGLLRRIRLALPLVIPLFLAALERSETLVEAMESRCYEPGRPRTRLKEYPWKRRDRAVLTGIVLIFSAVLGSRFFQGGLGAFLKDGAAGIFGLLPEGWR